MCIAYEERLYTAYVYNNLKLLYDRLWWSVFPPRLVLFYADQFDTCQILSIQYALRQTWRKNDKHANRRILECTASFQN